MTAAVDATVVAKKAKKAKKESVNTASAEGVPAVKVKKVEKAAKAEEGAKPKKRKAQADATDAPLTAVKVKKKKLKVEELPPSSAASDSADSEQFVEVTTPTATASAAAAASAAPVAPADPLALDNFRLSEGVKALLREKGIQALFKIQSETLNQVLDGNDLVGRARCAPSGHSAAQHRSPHCLLSKIVHAFARMHVFTFSPRVANAPACAPGKQHALLPVGNRTGQGKTLAFVLPIVERLLAQNSDGVARKQHGRLPRVIVLAPTRELAKQALPALLLREEPVPVLHMGYFHSLIRPVLSWVCSP